MGNNLVWKGGGGGLGAVAVECEVKVGTGRRKKKKTWKGGWYGIVKIFE